MTSAARGLLFDEDGCRCRMGERLSDEDGHGC
jgi:hypothetical protein